MKDVLKNFLNAYWLRPETALWRTLDVESMKGFEFAAPSLDLGCGDGTFSFIRGGGVYRDDFDVFWDVKCLDEYWSNTDVYDSYDTQMEKREAVEKKADHVIDAGMDFKGNLLRKAEKLGLYRRFINADANEILPFENESFQSVFSNIIYWLDDPEKVFKEIYRILRHDGTCCVMLPDITFLETSFYYSLYEKAGLKQFEFLRLIDRGRITENIKVVKSYAEWKNIIENAGLEIQDCIPHLSKTLLRIWDIGLRPIFPMLKKMTAQIEKNSLMEIKKEWIDLFLKIGYPIIENDRMLAHDSEFCFFCFILRKK